MKSLKGSIAFFILAGGLTLFNIAHSALITADFHWVGDGGYRAEGTFVYDNAWAVVDAEGSNYGNFNNGLNYLEIGFYNPSSNLLYNVINAQGDAVSYAFLDFTFNTSTLSFEGGFDMGEDTGTAGEYHIYGTIGGNDSFFVEVNGSATDSQATPRIDVTLLSVPEPGTISLLLMGLFCLVGLAKRPG